MIKNKNENNLIKSQKNFRNKSYKNLIQIQKKFIILLKNIIIKKIKFMIFNL